jgi:hypothetical protein
MTMAIRIVASLTALAAAAAALSATAQSAREIHGPTPYVAIPNEAPPRLIVDPPIPEQLALGKVFIQYRTENVRIVPVFGAAALSVSPRVGHMHIIVDDSTWPIVYTSEETFVAVGLKPGPHKVVFQIADAVHHPFPFPGATQTVTFVVPDVAGAHNH